MKMPKDWILCCEDEAEMVGATNSSSSGGDNNKYCWLAALEGRYFCYNVREGLKSCHGHRNIARFKRVLSERRTSEDYIKLHRIKQNI